MRNLKKNKAADGVSVVAIDDALDGKGEPKPTTYAIGNGVDKDFACICFGKGYSVADALLCCADQLAVEGNAAAKAHVDAALEALVVPQPEPVAEG